MSPLDVAVNELCTRAPDLVVMRRPDFASGSFLSQWRNTLRRFLLASCRAVSPRPLPSRDFTRPTSRVSAMCLPDGPPHGFAQLPNPLPGGALPHNRARSSLGFAFKQDFYVAFRGRRRQAREVCCTRTRRRVAHPPKRAAREMSPLGSSKPKLWRTGDAVGPTDQGRSQIESRRSCQRQARKPTHSPRLSRLFPPRWIGCLDSLRRRRRGAFHRLQVCTCRC